MVSRLPGSFPGFLLPRITFGMEIGLPRKSNLFNLDNNWIDAGSDWISLLLTLRSSKLEIFPIDSGIDVIWFSLSRSNVRFESFPIDSGISVIWLSSR